jgi:diguanylate cyclase (GGDEF)-like protein
VKKPTPMAELTRIDEARARIEHLAYHDPLTGLPNRLLLNDRLSVALSRSGRSESLVAVLFLDLDNFKPVNDRLGHVGGDGLLRETARRLQAVMRQGDTLARLGGDEFVVVVEDLKEVGSVVRIAEKILAAIRDPFEIEGHDFFLTASIGVSIGQRGDLRGEGLIHNADTAMYRAKEKGRNRYELYSPALSSRAEARRDLESGLRRAIEAGELALAYQPVFEIGGDRPVGVEAFARWPSRDRGPVPPAEFIPVAEEMGLIVALGRSLLVAACRKGAQWRRTCGEDLFLSVNVSPFQLMHSGFPSDLGRILDECSYPARLLCLEISGRVPIELFDASLKALAQLKAMGVQFAIDDFGGGSSSFGTLRKFVFDYFKIDPSFIQALRSDSRDAAIAKSLIRVAHLLEAKAVAEGVETAEQLEFLRCHRRDAAQGWLFAPAVTPEAFERDFLPKKRE